MTERILVIRLGALGDLVLCFQAFQSIRAAHPKAEIAMLTMPAFADFARRMPWFDSILIDPRLPRWRLDAWIGLVNRVRTFAPARVYDLQGKSRQTILYVLLKGPLEQIVAKWNRTFGSFCGVNLLVKQKFAMEWSGAAPLCSHPRLWPPKPGMHFTDFAAAQLERAGVPLAEKTDLDWLDAPIDNFKLPEKFALLIPGCGPGRAYKRWPAARYAELAARLMQKGIASVAIGAGADEGPIRELCVREESVIDLCNKTSLFQVAALARRAEYVIGNDTGPTHIAAAVGARTVALISDSVNPIWAAPKGPRATWLQGKPLRELEVETVWNACRGSSV